MEMRRRSRLQRRATGKPYQRLMSRVSALLRTGSFFLTHPDKRADSWLKVKKDYIAEIGDSIDLVPIGAWHGMGRKNRFWSPILLGVYDDDEGAFTAVCKCMSGFSDAFYESLNETYAEGGPNTSSRPFAGVVVGGGLHMQHSEFTDICNPRCSPGCLL